MAEKQGANRDHHVTIIKDAPGKTKAAAMEKEKKYWSKWTALIICEWIVLVLLVGLLLVTLSVNKLKVHVFWGLQLWKWCVLVISILCSAMFSRWLMNLAVYLISWRYGQRVKVMYFVYGLRISVRLLVWFGSVLVAWRLLVIDVNRPKETMRILNDITRGLACSLLGAFIWFMKTLLVKVIGCNYQGESFFQKIHTTIHQKNVVEGLLKKPKKRRKGSPLTMNRFLKFTSGSALTIWLPAPPPGGGGGGGDNKEEVKKLTWSMEQKAFIRSEKVDDNNKYDKKEVAETTFKELRKKIPNVQTEYIPKDDFVDYLDQHIEETDYTQVLEGLFQKHGHGEDAKAIMIITQESLESWLVKVCEECIELPKMFKDNNTAIEELNRLLSGVAPIVIIIVWLLLMGFLTTKVLLFICSQTLLAGFMFSNTVKTLFEAIIFVFIVHPFNVYDECVVEGNKMKVHEMNLFTTIFLNQHNELIHYPNSVLATKPIVNLNESPNYNGVRDSVVFLVDASTSAQILENLENDLTREINAIKMDREDDPMFFDTEVVMEDFDDVDKIKIGLYFTHKKILNNYGEGKKRRSKVFLKLKDILKKHEIKYHSLSPIPPTPTPVQQ